MVKLLHSRKVLAGALKVVVIFVFAVLIFAGLGPVRWFAAYIAGIEPRLAPFAPQAVWYVNVGFVPVYLALILAWRVFSAIGRDESFSMKNAKRLRGAAVLSLVEAAYLMGGLFWFGSWKANSPFSGLCFLGLILLGLSAAVVCYALAQLIRQAAQLKEEADLTV